MADEDGAVAAGDFTRWLYRGGRPSAIARFVNGIWGSIFALGVMPGWVATLDVTGRKSGRTISLPVVLARQDGAEYLVSMLGADVAWVRNLEASQHRAVLRRGRVEHVLLEPVAVERRPPILKAYLRVAPGARPHIPVDKDAPLEAFAAIAGKYPVFRVTPLE